MNCPKRDDDGRLCSNDVEAFWGERDYTNRGAAANIWRVGIGEGVAVTATDVSVRRILGALHRPLNNVIASEMFLMKQAGGYNALARLERL
jgi:hypothetical protein